jgi:hypothetical protein
MRALLLCSVVCMLRLLLITAACCIMAEQVCMLLLAGCAVCWLTYYFRQPVPRQGGCSALCLSCAMLMMCAVAAAWSVCGSCSGSAT